MKSVFSLFGLSVLLGSSAFASSTNSIVLQKALIDVGSCIGLNTISPQQSLTFTYKTLRSNLMTEKIDGIHSYLVQLFQAPTIEGVEPITESIETTTMHFAGKQCDLVRNALLQKLR